MKKLICMIFTLFSLGVFAGEGDVLGTWITEKAKNGNQIIVEVYKAEDGKYNGRILSLTIPTYTEGKYIGQEKMDLENPDKSLKSRKLRGIDFVSGFDYDVKDDKYVNGNIYNPSNGRTYHSYMKLKEDGTLLVKGSIDRNGLIGKKQIWRRYEM